MSSTLLLHKYDPAIVKYTLYDAATQVNINYKIGL